MNKLLVVDDEQGIRQLLTLVFTRAGYAVRSAENGRRALELIEEEPADIIVSDIRMPDMNGIELLRAARTLTPRVAVVMMSAFATLDVAHEAYKLGAENVVQKPFDVEELKEIVRRSAERLSLEADRARLAQDKQQLAEENAALKSTQRERGQLDNLIGRSERMQAIYQMVQTVAEVTSTVLITGESGTGKELVASAIHNLSQRRDKPFVSINCGAFTETLLESELFGYVRGAFTGANTDRKGLFEAASKGTIFLDEIGEMPPSMQVKFLRVLQERKIRPVGGHQETAVDVRIIAATNRDLRQMVKDGTFREDLFYRISVIPIELPPLRERAGDIPVLINHFVDKFCDHTGRRVTVSPRALELLESYAWYGNVRELEHTIERLVALERTDQIQPASLPETITNYNPAQIAQGALALPEDGINLFAHLEHIEYTLMMEALRRTDGNQSRAAELLQIPVRSLRHLLDKYDARSATRALRDERRADDERRASEATPRRRATDPYPRRRVYDTNDDTAAAAGGNGNTN